MHVIVQVALVDVLNFVQMDKVLLINCLYLSSISIKVTHIESVWVTLFIESLIYRSEELYEYNTGWIFYKL